MTNLDKNELAKIGVQFGGSARWRHPQMFPFIYQKNKKTNILDLQKIISSCQEVSNYIEKLIEKKKTILFLATKKQIRDAVKEAAIKCEMPYIVNKWKGGFLTNFFEIKKKLKELERLNNFLERDASKSVVKKKKERVNLEKKRNKLQSIYGGVTNLHHQPDALFIIGLKKEKTAFEEAKSKRPPVPIIAVCNTNCNPRLVDYVIPGNDEGVNSAAFFANLVADIIIEARKGKGLENNNVNDEKKTMSSHY